MKKILLGIGLFLMMSQNLIAQSEPINLPLETKREIVLTLEMASIVIKERDLLLETVDIQEEIIRGLKERLKNKDLIIDNRNEVIDVLVEESNLYAKKFKAKTLSMYIYANAPLSSTQPQAGAMFVVKEKLMFSVGTQYNELNNNLGITVGLGLKIF